MRIYKEYKGGAIACSFIYLIPILYRSYDTSLDINTNVVSCIRHSSNKTSQKKYKKKNTHLNDGVYFQPDLVKSYGYPLEEHFVETEDGYKLTLHRIPGVQRKNQGNKKAPIVLLAHCLMSSSAVFTYGPTNNSLAYVLANKGW